MKHNSRNRIVWVKEAFKLVILSALTACVVATILFESIPLESIRKLVKT